MKGKVRKKYDKEFKLMVVNLCLSGRNAKELAFEMDLDRSMVQRWVREYNTYSDSCFKGNGNAVMTVEQKEIARLAVELKQTQIERDIFKKSGEYILQERHQKYAFIKKYKATFTVEDMCRVLCVNKSGYYYWLSRKESPRAIALREHTKEIVDIYEFSKKRYSSYKIHAELRARGIITSRNRVARIMKKSCIKSIEKCEIQSQNNRLE
jgi:transposase-like protein